MLRVDSATPGSSSIFGMACDRGEGPMRSRRELAPSRGQCH